MLSSSTLFPVLFTHMIERQPAMLCTEENKSVKTELLNGILLSDEPHGEDLAQEYRLPVGMLPSSFQDPPYCWDNHFGNTSQPILPNVSKRTKTLQGNCASHLLSYMMTTITQSASARTCCQSVFRIQAQRQLHPCARNSWMHLLLRSHYTCDICWQHQLWYLSSIINWSLHITQHAPNHIKLEKPSFNWRTMPFAFQKS